MADYPHRLKDDKLFYTSTFLISDLRMPGTNGYELIRRAKQIKPEVKIFFMTTFEIKDIEFRRLLPSVKIDEFIQKPITMNYLATLVKSILALA